MAFLPDLPVHYTRHAKGRMRWRRIGREDVEAVLAEPDRMERMDGKFRLAKTINGRRLLVIVAVEHDRIVVITAMERT